MGRYFKSLRRFWGTAVASQLEYQLNVVIELVAVGLSLLGSLFMLSLFFGPGRELGGWSWHEALIVQGFYTVLDGMASTWLRPNLSSIVTHVREGTLDFVLLKPIDSQFWLSLRTISPAGLPEIVSWLVVGDLGRASGWCFFVARRHCGGVADALGWWIDPVFALVFDCSDQHLVCENLECH